MEFTLLLSALTGVGALWLALHRLGAGAALDLTVTAGSMGLLAGRLVAMAGAGVNPLTSPLDVLVVRGGVDTVGATAGAVAVLLWHGRRDPELLGNIAPAGLAGLGGWHAGCLWRGSCLGAAGDVPWGWALAGSAVTRHPVELYAAVLLLLAAWALTRSLSRHPARFGQALAAAAAARLVTEPLRPSLDGGPVWWYAAGVAVGLLGAYLAWQLWPPSPAPMAADRGERG